MTNIITRRTFNSGMLSGLASLLLGGFSVAASEPKKETKPTEIFFPVRDISTIVEFADEYRTKHLPKEKKEVNILYPGSGSDLTPLEIGLQLLHKSDVERVNYVFTEIGDYEKDLPAWHGGLKDLTETLERKLDDLKEKGGALSIKKQIKEQPRRKGLPSSVAIEYTLDIPTQGKTKTLTLTLGYNTFENRKEPTEEEKRAFSPKLIAEARTNYWPEKREKGKMYPTYFNQDQFDQADIILSKFCGDFALLRFDYVRALARTKTKKPRIILTEHPERMDAVKESLSEYNTSVRTLKNNDYGYCDGKDCQVGYLVASPK